MFKFWPSIILATTTSAYLAPPVVTRQGLHLRKSQRWDVEEPLAPGFRRTGEQTTKPREKARMGTLNQKIKENMEATTKDLRIEAPQIEDRVDIDLTDINGPLYMVSSIAALAAAYGLYAFATFVATAFATHPFASDYYPIERFANFLRQAVIAALSLLTGLTGFSGIGVFVLGAYVSLSKMQGSTPTSFPLDNDETDPDSSPSSPAVTPPGDSTTT